MRVTPTDRSRPTEFPRQSSLERRRLADYLQATENEIIVDQMAFKLAGVDPALAGFIPRPAKWLSHAEGRHWAFRLGGLVASAVWRLGGAAVYHFVQLLRAYAHARRCGHQLAAATSMNAYVLALSTRVGDIMPPENMGDAPACWITMPWAPLARVPDGTRCFDVFSLLTGRDLLAAYGDAVAAGVALARRRGASPWVLQTYTAFQWFAVRRALEKLDGRFVMAEHFDRWAVLADSAVTRLKSRRSAAGRERPGFELVQHGAMGALSAAEPGAASQLRLRRRLRSVTSLYVYDAGSAAAFTNDVLSAGCTARGVSVRYFKPKIALQPNPCDGARRVLFVGHPFCEDLQACVLESLKRSCDIRAFYKPHPLSRMNERMNGLDWTVIRDKNHFPQVDLLVSYPSTLIAEYATWNVPAVVHPMDLAPDQAAALVASATKELERIAPHRS